MPRTGKRRTIARGVYADSGGFEIRATVGGVTYTERHPPGTELDKLKRARAVLVSKGQTDTPRAVRHTLRADAPIYLKLVRNLVSFKNRRAQINAWVSLFPDVYRHQLTAQDVLGARATWQESKLAPKTINHRIAALRHLYRTLDGKAAGSPCDEIAPLHVPRTPIQRVSDTTILAVEAELQRRERYNPQGGHKFDGAKTRARFRVLVTTGRRPSEIMRAQPGDVDLDQRVWVPRDGKGGWSPGLYLNDDMLAAWRLFIEAKAWGKYNTSSFVETIRAAGWPAHVRPYNARHTTWITAVERGVDMADVQMGAGHKSLTTTRIYTGVRESRMQRLSEALEGRFGGFPVVPVSDSARKRKRA